MKLTQSQERQRIPEDVIADREDVNKSNHENHPDKNVGDNTRGQVVSMHRNSTIPEQSSQRPGIWSRDSRPVHERRRSEMDPICRRLAQDMDNEDDLGWPEKVSGPKHDESEDQEVVEDEMGGNIGSAGDEGSVSGEQMPEIAKLGQ